jgi:parvulin-like peptidyl-prolyl isomerase
MKKGISVLYRGIRRWAREPLLHFLLIGAALFVIYYWRNPTAANSDTSRRIELTNDDIRQIEISWTAQWQRPPTSEEIRNLVEDKVRQEILYREGLALGLDRDDTIVKRRLAQKMEFLSDDVSGLRDPSLDELKKWYAKNGAQFSLPSRITFRHLYFSPDKRGAQARDAAASALAKLPDKSAATIDLANLGDPFMFQDHYGEITSDQVANVFGRKFAEELFKLTLGKWHGPVESGLGWHLVWVDSINPGRTPEFEEVDISEIKSQWLAAQRAEIKRKLFANMKARYEIVLPRGPQSVAAATTWQGTR